MKELLNGLEKLFKAYGETAHLPKWLISEITFYIVLFGFLLTLLGLLWKFINSVIVTRNQKILNRDLHPYFSKSDVDRATRYYIPSKYQNVAPSEDDEPGRHYIASAKDKLIPLFLKKVFKFGEDDHKFYLILADAGMGKTTSMINLFLAYKNQWKLPWHLLKYDIKLFPLGAPNILEEVKSIDKKDNTILLLDAFDEDIKALHDHDSRMKEILKAVANFRKIVVTSRTQFFPSKKEEPHETGYITYGDGNTERKFQKLYLSVFDEIDIKKYLRKRFSPFSRIQKKYYRAYKIVKKSPNLMVRPMLLSHIEDLVKSKTNFEFGYQIYEVLIDKWIEREASKPDIKEKYQSKERYKKLLNEFSHQLSIDLYVNKEKRGGYFIAKNEGFRNDSALSLTDIEEDNLKLSEAEMRSKSLLNRNAEGQYKFSHKSILEYYLAKEAAVNTKFFLSFSFDGNEAARNFFSEIVFNKILIPTLTKCDGSFSTASTKPKPINELSKNDFGKIKILKIKNISERLDFIYLSCLESLEVLVIFDKKKYKLLYHMYSLLLLTNLKLPELQELLDRIELLELLKLLNQQQLLDRLEQVDRIEVLELLLNQLEQHELLDRLKHVELEQPEKLKRLEQVEQERLEKLKWVEQERLRVFEQLQLDRIERKREQKIRTDRIERQEREQQIRLDQIERQEREQLEQIQLEQKRLEQKWLEFLERLGLSEITSDEKNIKEINSYLKRMRILRKRLSSCEIYY